MTRRIVTATDVVAVFLTIAAGAIAITGGFRVQLFGVRFAVTSAWRVLLWAAALIAVRHVVSPRPPLHREILRWRDRWRGSDAYLRLVDRAGACQPLPGSWAYGGAMFLLFTALTAVMTYPQIFHLREAVHDPGDPLLNLWALAWIAHQLPSAPAHLFDANIFAPERATLAYSETLLAPALVAVPLLWAGAGRVLVYNLVFLSGFVLSGVGTALLVRDLTRSAVAGTVAGVVFAFLPFRFDHLPQLQLQQAEWIPLSVWALHRLLARGRAADALGLGVLVAAQLLSCVYYGVYLSGYLLVFGGVLLASNLTVARRRLPMLAAAAAIAVALVSPVGRAYIEARETVGERTPGEIAARSASWRAYLAAPAANRLYGWTRERYGAEERNLFLGTTAMLLAAIGLWPPWSAVRVACAIAGAFALNVTLGFNAPLYTFLWEHVPIVRALRIPALAIILVGFSIALLAGFGVARLVALPSLRRWRIELAALCGLAVLAEACAGPMPLMPVPDHAPPAYAALLRDLRSAGPATIVEMPMIVGGDQTYMYYSTFHWQRLVNGYSGFFPASYLRLVAMLRQFPDPASLDALADRGVRYALLHGELLPAHEYARLVDAVEGCSCGLTLVAATPWADSEIRLYRLDRPPSAVSH